MPQGKKRTTSKRQTTKKKGKKRTTKKQNDHTLRFLLAIIAVIVLILGIFQLGIIGIAIDSFFNYLFGMGRYYVYILLLLATGFLAFNGKLPKSRRMLGSILLLPALLLIAQFVYLFTSGEKARREPVLSHVFHTYDITRFSNFGGGLFGYYMFELFIPLISIVGLFLLMSLLLISSIILLQQKKHRDVSKSAFERTQSRLNRSVSSYKDKRANRRANKEDKPVNRRRSKKPKDVSNFEDVTPTMEDHPTGSSSIPIYGHQDEDDVQQPEPQAPTKETPKPTSTPKREPAQQEASQLSSSGEVGESEGSISEAGEAENHAYTIPPLTLLNEPKKQKSTSKAEVQKKGRLLENTLKNFGVNANVTQIKIGPAVTQYEIQPAQGVKVSKIVNLHSDIALALAAKDVRIEAPIPGKSAVGIEVPNDHIALVSLKEVLDEKFPAKNKLEVALGRDISGDPITAELNKMPHLLVAGSTGSGKSVCINGIITSILLNAKPHEVKLMMIDPKMVELNVYNGIPHLLTPVVTNPQKASQALDKIVGEMERRYDLFQHTGTRNIEGYNQYIEKSNQDMDEKQAKLPYIVVIVDELADLMMVAGKDVEGAITRITQMARAAGIHLIIATQRPSVDVITGLIKNNIPSRIAFAVSSQTDSRTIIDSSGAEKLLGKGDMLFVANGGSIRTRVQGAFLSDEEVQTVVNYVVEQQKANYVKEMEPDAPVDKSEMESEDPIYPDAYMFVVEKQKASTSLLQRQFRIGYNRASRLMDDLERNNIIGPQKGSKPRQVLVDLSEEEV
ncbi:DNA translocase FtsK [Staphylococcus massiliensis]|uniref:DNA translocase FtsK n=1 Tax=Staphylococcus massiliensis TaxID=555791 RepID=UPI001EDFB7E4|nr:DNA translocase FtsK [Staphylococcus massiliensis]MCG3398734.1 DNA translocase FtsK [Staphylococcus massiliensis]MCG3411923.1 DNA translocase FtsK [Staphylococcus massiliensis]